MARGATKTAEQQAQDTLNSTKAAQDTAQATAASTLGQMTPVINSYLQPGGDPATTAATMGALGSVFGTAKQQAMDNATRTNNAATTNATIDAPAREQGMQGADAAAKNVSDQKSKALGLLSSLYSGATQQVRDLLGLRNQSNNSYIDAINSGGSALKTVFGGIGGALSGAAKANQKK